jgi:hypothetical protein
LDKRFAKSAGFPLILLPVAASVPRVEEPEEKKKEPEPQPEPEIAGRISRAELYAQITDTSKLSLAYVVMVVLSAMVAAIGLLNNNTAVVIGAMVIAPLLGPNIALAWPPLHRRGWLTTRPLSPPKLSRERLHLLAS